MQFFFFGSPKFLVGTKKRRDVLQAGVYHKLLIRMTVYSVHTIEIFNAYLI